MILEKDYFTLFGLARCYAQDLIKLKQCYLLLQQKAHPDNHVNSALVDKHVAADCTAYINEGYRTLLCPLKRAIYLLKLHGIDATAETQTHFPTEFLMEQMALREDLENISAEPEKLVEMKQQIDQAGQLLTGQFSESLQLSPPDLSEATLCVQKLQFYYRLNEEIIHLQQIAAIN